jgi:hypothetical protein
MGVPVKAVIHVNHAEHQRTHGAAMKAGMERHGVAVEFAPFDRPEPCDVAVVWGWRQAAVNTSGAAVLVMERGHLPDRMAYTACGWNGLGRRGAYPTAALMGDSAGLRWNRHFAPLLEPWRHEREPAGATAPEEDAVVIFGQVDGDASLYNLRQGFQAWAEGMAKAAAVHRRPIVYRPHPLSVRYGNTWHPAGTELSIHRPLADDLARAWLAVTYNSTSGVEAVLAGVPIVVMDAGGMAWDVARHDVGTPLRPDRTAWAHDMAWTSWTMEEIAAGDAWAALAACLPEDGR